MENNKLRLSIGAKTIILILLFLNAGYAYKKIKQYKHNKEAGYIRERSVQEQIQKRVMKSFGSVEEMDRLVADFAKLKENAEKLATALKEQDKQLSKAYKELKNAKIKNKEENAHLQKRIRDLEGLIPERKKQ